METKVTLSVARFTDDELSATISCYSGLPFDNATPLALNFSAAVSAVFCKSELGTLPAARHDETNLVEVDTKRLYS